MALDEHGESTEGSMYRYGMVYTYAWFTYAVDGHLDLLNCVHSGNLKSKGLCVGARQGPLPSLELRSMGPVALLHDGF